MPLTPAEQAEMESLRKELGQTGAAPSPAAPPPGNLTAAENEEMLSLREELGQTAAPLPTPEEPKFEQREGDDGMVGGLISSAAQGLSLGTADRAESAIRAWWDAGGDFTSEEFDTAYDKHYAAERGQTKKFREAHPVASTIAEVGGAVLPGIAAGALTGGTGTAGVLGSTAARLAMVGAGGAIYGGAESEGDMGSSEQVQDALMGGGFSLATFGLLKGLGKAVSKSSVTRNARKFIEKHATSDNAFEVSKKAFKTVDDFGAQVKPATSARMYRKVLEKITEPGNAPQKGRGGFGGEGSIHTQTREFLKNMKHTLGENPTVRDIEMVRRAAYEQLVKGDNPNRKFGFQIRDVLAKELDKLRVSDFADNVDKAGLKKVLGDLTEARAFYRVGHKLQALEKIMQHPELVPGTPIRAQLEKILGARFEDTFSKTEQKAIVDILEKHGVGWFTRQLGKLPKVGGVMGAMAMAAHPVAGTAAAASAIGRGAADRAKARAGKKTTSAIKDLMGSTYREAAGDDAIPAPSSGLLNDMFESASPGISRYMGGT